MPHAIPQIDDTTLITHGLYNDQASMDAGTVKGALPHLDPAEVAKVLDGPGTRMTGPVVFEVFASRAAGAISTNFMTVADGNMDKAMAWIRAYDVRAVPGRFRIICMQADANTLISTSMYDTVESLEARKASAEAEGSNMEITALFEKVERVAGPVAWAVSGTGPRTYSDSKVASTRRMKVHSTATLLFWPFLTCVFRRTMCAAPHAPCGMLSAYCPCALDC